MAKLSLALLALVAALLVVADATIVRTTITTTEIEEDHPHGGSSQQCPTRQLQGKRFNSCRSYLRQSSRPYDILRVVDVNRHDSQEQETLQECCDELKEVQQELRNPQCACEALKKIVQEESEQSTRSRGQQGMRPLLQKAKNIPEQCNLQIRSCRIQEY